MGPLDFLLHLLGFFAPALAVALGTALGARWLGLQGAGARAAWVPFAINFAAGCAVLVAGLAWFGRDGKMLTYAALVAAIACSQWLIGRAWRR
jgi:hypothetical protein